jgi:hypothetical protein
VRTTPSFFGYGCGLAILAGTFDYCGGVLSGYKQDPTADEFDRKELLRKNRRRPIEETVAELGEGRGRHIHWSINGAISNGSRYLRSWLREATAGEDTGEIWHRRILCSVSTLNVGKV